MDDQITYDKAELRSILRAFRNMDDEAIAKARIVSGELAGEAAERIKSTASSRPLFAIAAERIAYGVRVSKSSKIGEFSYGYASQRFSGGATTQMLWPGIEFGSGKYPQFRPWSGKQGRGSRGFFIYPTLRAMQPDIVSRWEDAFSQIVKEWDR